MKNIESLKRDLNRLNERIENLYNQGRYMGYSSKLQDKIVKLECEKTIILDQLELLKDVTSNKRKGSNLKNVYIISNLNNRIYEIVDIQKQVKRSVIVNEVRLLIQRDLQKAICGLIENYDYSYYTEKEYYEYLNWLDETGNKEEYDRDIIDWNELK